MLRCALGIIVNISYSNHNIVSFELDLFSNLNGISEELRNSTGIISPVF